MLGRWRQLVRGSQSGVVGRHSAAACARRTLEDRAGLHRFIGRSPRRRKNRAGASGLSTGHAGSHANTRGLSLLALPMRGFDLPSIPTHGDHHTERFLLDIGFAIGNTLRGRGALVYAEDDDGRRLEAEFTVEPDGGLIALVLSSASGR